MMLVIISAWKDKGKIIGTIQKKKHNQDNQNNTSNTYIPIKGSVH